MYGCDEDVRAVRVRGQREASCADSIALLCSAFLDETDEIL